MKEKKSLSKTDLKAMVDPSLAELFQRLTRMVVLVKMLKAAQVKGLLAV